jgi:diadenosine tetraphosphate (Ap4A) HIT family hydrolase
MFATLWYRARSTVVPDRTQKREGRLSQDTLNLIGDKNMMSCVLCKPTTEQILFENQQLRIILVDDPDYPGFCRIIWKQHIKEMSDLSAEDRQLMFDWLLRTEQALRQVMNPDKINLASLGNVVPHLHWHVIPRFIDDAHFPSPIWAVAQRKAPRAAAADLGQRLSAALLSLA